MGFKIKKGVSKFKCMHSARQFKTGSKSRRISKKARRSITLTICSGCGQKMKEN